MPVTRETLSLVRRLRVEVGSEADASVRALVKAWGRAWDEIAGQWRDGVSDLVALQAQLQRWPHAWEVSRVGRLRRALQAAEQSLTALAQQTGVTVSTAAGGVIAATAAAEPAVLASQLPAASRAAAAVTFADRLPKLALDAVVHRTTQRITAVSRPLSAAAYEAMQRELIRGVAVGDNPRETGRRMVARVRGAFDGGLVRATTVARTEVLDAYREASRASHTANSDVVSGYRWQATLDRRTCVACLAMNGETFGVTESGPADHQNGRCARVPVLRSWRQLGISLDEPPDRFPDARAWFAGLPEDQQVEMMGATRHALWSSGRVGWDDLAPRRSTSGWRDSYTPTSLRDLQRAADRRAFANV